MSADRHSAPHATKDTADVSMRRNGRSFWFASHFLSPATAKEAASLYAFCRTMDDLADQQADAAAMTRLHAVRRDLALGRSADPCVQAFFAVARRDDLGVADHLIASFLRDAETRVQIETEEELIRYCFGVAGTVGLMMSPILGATQPESRHPALHLGIAMQMTNIARDVLEDAANGRRYLPACWVDGLTPRQIVRAADARDVPAEQVRRVVSVAVERLLQLAETFYVSAAHGFVTLPVRNRIAITVAAAVYREIGQQLRRKGYAWWGGRTVVGASKKVSLAGAVLLGRSVLQRPRPSVYEGVHPALATYAGVL